ncbi:hypothetical protein Cob_v000480 [Colletotrichum orbiculare MAFF 240422]|uniref:Uncharacterized protein n=1 Tax=Colletotrichum orbiculare (strain 104-T / ATCC 96160 / CBS 514.97 / LARS 414 / MAFF 240422) TaxID=1213857 RepID=N4VIF6_COLOR|nr:hypothetical protein Cob_v000480 [Colletotrichum orbiculare MAFF 240422]
MDPLSIAASAAALAGTAGTLSMWLFDLVTKIKNVDSKLFDLSKEVDQLTHLLSSVEKTVKQCQSQVLTLAHLDQHMWEQINATLADCQCNIDGLDRLVIKLMSQYDPEAATLKRMLKKPSMHFHFVIHKDEIQDYTTKIVKSNYAMQTTLAVVSVSLNFRTTVSQEAIFQELERLNKLIQRSFQAAEQREAVPDPSSVRQSINLQSLAKAAKRFHTVATTTASSAYGGGERRPSTVFGGSEVGDLTDARRAEIEQWTTFNQLSVVDESAEDSMTEVSLSSGHRDTSTVVTIPDTESVSRGPTKPVDQPAAAADDSSDDDSDVELDFLRNSEELAYERFLSGDYSKSEKFLRMALERLTGDAQHSSDFRQLKVQLALCCCLQDKWDHAAGVIASLPKTRPADNLAVLDLLQAISIAHLAGGNTETAYGTCKAVLQGKKKVFGRESEQYYACLWLFASIHDKRGPDHALDAETVRHSIPRGWTPSIRDVLSSPKRFILDQENLVQSIFAGREGGQKRMPAGLPTAQQPADNESTVRSDFEATADFSGHWSTLIPKEPASGLVRAQREEMGGASIEETDTGKEMVVQNVPGIAFDLVPESSQPHHASGWSYHENQVRGSSSGHQDWWVQQENLAPTRRDPRLPHAVSPKRHGNSRSEDLTMPTWRSGPQSVGSTQQLPLRSFTQRLPPTPNTILENTSGILRSHSQQNRPLSRPEMVVTRSTPELPPSYHDEGRPDVSSRTESAPVLPLGHSRSVNRPLGHSRFIEKVEQAQSRSLSVRERPPHAQPSEQTYYQQNQSQPEGLAGIAEGDLYSTLEVVVPNDASAHADSPHNPWSPSSFLSPTSSSHSLRRFRSNASIHSNLSRRTRWTVQKDIGNIGQPRPSGFQGQFLPLSTSASDSGLCYVGVSFGVTSDGCVAVRTAQDETSICQLPTRPVRQDPSVQSPTSGMRGFFRKASPYSSRKPSPLADTSGFTVDLPSPRNWRQNVASVESMADLVPDETGLLGAQQAAAAQVEAEVTNILCRGGQSPLGTFRSLRLEALVYVLPDLLDRASRELWTGALEESALLQHAKVMPQSYAVVQYYLGSGQLVLDRADPDDRFESVVVVLNCEERLVDCTPYSLEAVSDSFVEIHDLQSSYMAELAGHDHAQAHFAKLVVDQLRVYERDLPRRFDAAAVHGIVASCCAQFRDRILPAFDSDGAAAAADWTVEFEIPSAVRGFQHGRLKFANSEVMRCFMPSVSMIRRMLAAAALQLSTTGVFVTHVLLAGSYSKSKYLLRHIDNAVREMRRPDFRPVQLLKTAECDDVHVLGALSHAMGS